jgi:hypothetical protein
MSVSTLIYTVRKDWSEETARSEQDKRRVHTIFILVAIAIGPGVFLVDRLAGSVAWRSFLAEALSLCLYAAVAVWYALRYQPGTARRTAFLVYLVGLVIMGLVNLITKSGLTELLVDSSRANETILLAGALMLLFLPALTWVARRYPIDTDRIGLSLTHPFSRLRSHLFVGLGVGLLIGFHFWLTAKTAELDLSLKPWPYMIWQFCYEAGPQSLTEELFMRGVVFNEFYFGRNWNFWKAALTASSLELLSLLVKQDYTADVLVIAGVVFYTVVASVASAGLFRWSRSLLPGYVSNVAFSMVSVFR